jgi:ankyrin repeat protein
MPDAPTPPRPSPPTPPIKETAIEPFIERLKRRRVVAAVLVIAAIVGGAASFTDSARKLVDLVRPAKAADPREQLAKLRLRFDADAFVAAAAKGDEVAVKLYLAASMPVDAPSREAGGATALIVATDARKTEVVKQLLAAHADLAARDGNRMTALALAASRGDVALTTLMLATNPDPAVVRNAWSNAAEAGQLEVLKLIAPRVLAEQPGLATATLFSVVGVDDAPSHAGQGQAQVVAWLLDQGADPRAVDEKRWTLVHHAAYHGAAEVVRQLLDRGAEADARDADGASPLWWAAGVGLQDTARVLLDRGADARLAAKDGTTVIARARYNKDEEMVALLKERGAR